ncbi:ATP-binding cassette transporter [Clonorchis sinensis]|uniref:ATP-binding cassette transporter n=1 Tax=Clonorchis sinensis TaxID=79923 RepID=G7YCL5_CLOSI|nr:ATP-binding cassette transporter [Clonorchis sinensis]
MVLHGRLFQPMHSTGSNLHAITRKGSTSQPEYSKKTEYWIHKQRSNELIGVRLKKVTSRNSEASRPMEKVGLRKDVNGTGLEMFSKSPCAYIETISSKLISPSKTIELNALMHCAGSRHSQSYQRSIHRECHPDQAQRTTADKCLPLCRSHTVADENYTNAGEYHRSLLDSLKPLLVTTGSVWYRKLDERNLILYLIFGMSTKGPPNFAVFMDTRIHWIELGLRPAGVCCLAFSKATVLSELQCLNAVGWVVPQTKSIFDPVSLVTIRCPNGTVFLKIWVDIEKPRRITLTYYLYNVQMPIPGKCSQSADIPVSALCVPRNKVNMRKELLKCTSYGPHMVDLMCCSHKQRNIWQREKMSVNIRHSPTSNLTVDHITYFGSDDSPRSSKIRTNAVSERSFDLFAHIWKEKTVPDILTIIKTGVQDSRNPSVQIVIEELLLGLEYAGDFLLVFDEEKTQVFLDEPSKIILRFGMYPAPTVLFHDSGEYLDSMEDMKSNPYLEDLQPMAIKRYIRFGKRIPKHQERSSRPELMELTGQPTEFIRFGVSACICLTDNSNGQVDGRHKLDSDWIVVRASVATPLSRKPLYPIQYNNISVRNMLVEIRNLIYMCTSRLMFQLARYSRYRDTLYESNTLHNLMSGVIQLLKNTNERFICVPGWNYRVPKLIGNLHVTFNCFFTTFDWFSSTRWLMFEQFSMSSKFFRRFLSALLNVHRFKAFGERAVFSVCILYIRTNSGVIRRYLGVCSISPQYFHATSAVAVAISRVALLAAYSRAGPISRTGRFARPASHLAADSVRSSSVTTLNTSKSVFEPRNPVYLATFNVRSLKQAGQQVVLARTLDSLCIGACCLSETRTQDASSGYAPLVMQRPLPLLLEHQRGLRPCTCVRKTRTPRLAIEKLVDPEVKRNYQNQLLECCRTPTSSKRWIYDRTVSLLETRRQIPPGRHHNSTRRIIRRQVKLSVRADREAWWTRKAEEMEDAKNAGNVRRLFRLIRSTGSRKSFVSETIRDQNGSLICNKAERLDRWAQYFEQQFSWPPATSNPESWPSTESWTVNMEPPSVSGVSECISLLKRQRRSSALKTDCQMPHYIELWNPSSKSHQYCRADESTLLSEKSNGSAVATVQCIAAE